MSSVGVWCTISAAEYPLLTHTLRPLLEHERVTAGVIVHTGSKPHADFGFLASTFEKVEEIHRDFGQGFNKSIEDGGYDQYSARNFALEAIEKKGVEWLLQFDADEYFDPAIISIVAALDHRYDAVCCSYYTLLSETEYWYEPRLEKTIRGTRLFHPHTLIWRTALGKRCAICPTSAKLHKNITRHCSVSFEQHPYWRILLLDEWMHFHLHCLLGKEHSEQRKRSAKIPRALPLSLVECIRAINHPEFKRGNE
jgi:hypothetical protein